MVGELPNDLGGWLMGLKGNVKVLLCFIASLLETLKLIDVLRFFEIS